MLTITLVGTSLFVGSQILKSKGHKNLSESILPIAMGSGGLWLLWEYIHLLL